HDLKTTPLQTNVPGVYMHASALGNILEQDLLTPPKNLFTYLSIALIGFFTVVSVLATSHLRMQILRPAAITTLFLFSAYFCFYWNQVIVMVAPTAAVICAWALSFIWLLATEGQEKKKIRQMFSRYVSPAALTTMVGNFDDYETAGIGKREIVSIMFSDVRGFTTYSPWRRFFFNQSLLVAADFSYSETVDEENKNSVLNFALGTEYYFTHTWAVRAGLYNNNANTPELKSSGLVEESIQAEHVNLFGASLSISYYSRYSALSFGFNYCSGSGDAQLFPAQGGRALLQEAEVQSLTLFLSASYAY
ncbi:hypothetical protein, partial [Kaarinaea lacus]